VRVRLLGDISGTRDGVNWPPRGSEIDLPDDEAAQLCGQQMAEPVVDLEAGVERAVVDDSATEMREALVPTVKKRGRPRKAAAQ
jgi:hypothetical protein